MARDRLFQLMERREVARAAQAATGVSAALGRAKAAGTSAARHAALAADLDLQGQVTAASLAAQRRLAADLASEAARQRGLESVARAEALRLRRLLARHDVRRRLYSEAATRLRVVALAEADRLAREALPGVRRGQQGLASDLQGAGNDPEAAA
jgi:hypothetical protein